MKLDYNHIQAAHCENGVTTGLLRNYGVKQITEPLAFGIGSGLFFIYIPFMKVNNGPAISFRTMPGMIFKRTCTSLHIPVVRKKFSSPIKAQEELDKRLESGHPAACQVGVYYLTYFPPRYRFPPAYARVVPGSSLLFPGPAFPSSLLFSGRYILCRVSRRCCRGCAAYPAHSFLYR